MSDTTTTTFTVPGMTCGGCASKVQKAVNELEGITSVEGNPGTKLVQVDYNPSVVTESELVGAIEGAGYPVQR